MENYSSATEVDERTMGCGRSHKLSVTSNPGGGSLVTCVDCGWWSTIPSGERLKGWDDGAADLATRAAA